MAIQNIPLDKVVEPRMLYMHSMIDEALKLGLVPAEIVMMLVGQGYLLAQAANATDEEFLS
jgi:hypothetical protein